MTEAPTAARAAGTVRRLIAARAARSVGQGALVVDFTLYLRALHWDAVQISGLLAASLLVGAGLAALFGPLSDRTGRRVLLIGYEFVQALAALAALLGGDSWLLAAAAVVGGFGRGANGAAGPFSPVEQSWLAQVVAPQARGRVYSRNAAVGFAGMAAGAALAALPARLAGLLPRTLPGTLPGALAYRPLFLLLPFLGSLAAVALLRGAADAAPAPRRPAPAPETTAGAARREENALLWRLAFANALNGTGIGMTGPLISWWFAVRFGQGPALIGPVMAFGFLAAGASSLFAGWLSHRVGVVRAVVAMRAAGLALLVALPFAPGFGLAAALYVLRSVCNRGTAGARSALSVSLVRPERRGFAATVSAVSMQIPRGLSPVLAGLMFQHGLLALPFLAGAGFQAAYLWCYGRFFAAHDPGTTRSPSRGGSPAPGGRACGGKASGGEASGGPAPARIGSGPHA